MTRKVRRATAYRYPAQERTCRAPGCKNRFQSRRGRTYCFEHRPAWTSEQLHKRYRINHDGRPFSRITGRIIGSVSKVDGYRRVTFRHRVWVMTRGEYPRFQIDHVDGNRDNNRPGNLRDVPQSVNRRNRRKIEETDNE